MIIESEDLQNLAYLAKIKLGKTEQISAKTDLNRIMLMIAEMQSVDTSGIEAMANPLDAVQRLRIDAVTETDLSDKFQKLSDYAKHGLYTVPRVIE